MLLNLTRVVVVPSAEIKTSDESEIRDLVRRRTQDSDSIEETRVDVEL